MGLGGFLWKNMWGFWIFPLKLVVLLQSERNEWLLIMGYWLLRADAGRENSKPKSTVNQTTKQR